jgi:hypothetical protein
MLNMLPEKTCMVAIPLSGSRQNSAHDCNWAGLRLSALQACWAGGRTKSCAKLTLKSCLVTQQDHHCANAPTINTLKSLSSFATICDHPVARHDLHFELANPW